MISLFSLLGLLFLVAATLLCLPILHPNSTRAYKIKVLLPVFIVFFLLTWFLYLLVGGAYQVKQYQSFQHAQQLKAELGSVNVIIQKMQQHLKAHPDAKGWYLLGKLYLSQNQFAEAAIAFKQAQALDPKEAEFAERYNQASLLAQQANAPGITVLVNMPAKIKQEFNPETVLFVLIKAPGIPMPIAAEKRQIKDLPLQLKFTDQSLLKKEGRLTDYQTIEIIARTSLGGGIVTTQGDYQAKMTLKNWSKKKLEPASVLIDQLIR